MTKAGLLLLAAASALALPGCDRAERHDSTEAAQANAAADEQAIRGHIDRWLQLIRAKDAAGIAAFYTEDGVLMPPNMPIATGRPAVQQVWGSMMQTPGFDLTFAPEQITFSKAGDMAIDRGTYRFSATPEGRPFSETGKYLVVWRKVGNEWKVAADIFNSDGPAAGG